MNSLKMYFLIPCRNEEETLKYTAKILTALINRLETGKLIDSGKILFVDDNSTDNTKKILKNLSSKKCEYISLSRNMGQQQAILFGMKNICEKCDFAITLDCDLQDDIEKISEMIQLYISGNEIVYGIRNDRKSDTFLKKISAQTYYFLLKSVDKNTVVNHGDFRLMSRVAMEKIIKNSGHFTYIRGIAPKLNLKSACVYYKRKKRTLGKSKYNIRKMLYLALCGLCTAFIKIKD